MLISESKKFLFIHIQKTGGQSLRASLKGVIPDLEEGWGSRYHARLSDVLQAYPSVRVGEYYTAAFVRNPWDRLVSWYADIVQNAAIRQNPLRQGVLRKARSFEEFVLHCHNVPGRDGRMPFSLNQIDYLTDTSGDLAVDFIGRFENFEDNAATLLRYLGLPQVRIPHLNRSHRKAVYRAYFTHATAEVVRRRFSRDIDMFGYTF